jgi:hypothetical protein
MDGSDRPSPTMTRNRPLGIKKRAHAHEPAGVYHEGGGGVIAGRERSRPRRPRKRADGVVGRRAAPWEAGGFPMPRELFGDDVQILVHVARRD